MQARPLFQSVIRKAVVSRPMLLHEEFELPANSGRDTWIFALMTHEDTRRGVNALSAETTVPGGCRQWSVRGRGFRFLSLRTLQHFLVDLLLLFGRQLLAQLDELLPAQHPSVVVPLSDAVTLERACQCPPLVRAIDQLTMTILFDRMTKAAGCLARASAPRAVDQTMIQSRCGALVRPES